MPGLLDLLTAPDSATALVEPASRSRVSYGQLREQVGQLAAGLAAHGVEPGDVVAFSMVNGPEIVTAFLAVVAAGAAAAPLNPAYRVDEFTTYLEDLRPRLVLRRGDDAPAAGEACAALGIPQAALDDLAGGGSPPAADPDAVALLLHTSGTTSRPKQVPIRQRNLAASATTVARTYGLGPDDASHCVMPLFHVHGLVASTLATLASGGTVICPRRFSATAFWEDGAAHGATWFSAVPTIHQILVARDRDGAARPPHALRFARSCSSALAPALMAEFEDRVGVPLVEAYGMTEAAHQMASNPLPPGERRGGSVGLATGTEIAILDDDWNALPALAVGEVAVRGPGVVDGYRANPEANAASFRDGWFRTGDSGSLDGEGYLALAGRIKELINRGGEKISPHEVEDVLLRHGAVAEAVAFALPDAKYGETVGAVVVLRADAAEEALRTHCAAHLASFKVPVRIVAMDAIPKGPTGKLQRRRMAELIGAA
jgi:acyl-CoA synthetase (AMP-forming)/AMP-acid ligase II